jgi:glycosyltransferase involved in cell wall biosynthesis
MVIPSRWLEPFVVVALDGPASCCVLLASDGAGFPEAVVPAGLLLKSGVIADLTRALHVLIFDGELRTRLRQQAPAHLARFQESIVCFQYLQQVGILSVQGTPFLS